MPKYRTPVPAYACYRENPTLMSAVLVCGTDCRHNPITFYAVGLHFGCSFTRWGPKEGLADDFPTWLASAETITEDHRQIGERLGIQLPNN